MTFGLTLMIVSGLVMIALIVHKRLETTKGIVTRVHAVRGKTDPVLADAHEKAQKFVSWLTLHNFILAVNHGIVHAVRFFMHLSHKAHSVSSSIVEKASKKTEDLSKRGAASFYLKQIKDAKEKTSNL